MVLFEWRQRSRCLSATSEAEAMRVLLRDLGIPDEAILLETRSRNTRENARFSAACCACEVLTRYCW